VIKQVNGVALMNEQPPCHSNNTYSYVEAAAFYTMHYVSEECLVGELSYILYFIAASLNICRDDTMRLAIQILEVLIAGIVCFTVPKDRACKF
jgi:hypothetical protein